MSTEPMQLDKTMTGYPAKTEVQDVPPGYKRTEVGVIPEDWDITMIGACAETSSGTTPSRALADRYYKNGNIAWVKTLDLNNSDIHFTNEYVTPAALTEAHLRCYPIGTIVVAMYGGFNQIGRTGLLRIPASVNQALTAVRPDVRRLLSEYLLAVLNFRVGYWKTVASSSRKDPNITGKDIRDFPLALPRVSEQRSIAEALWDVDELLGALDALIAKKRAIKQAAMRQLLTGKTRLPGFSGVWDGVKLGDIFDFKNGLNKAKEFFGQGTPIVNYMDVFEKSALTSSELTGRVQLSRQEIQNFDVRCGDVFFTRTSETTEEIGIAAVMMDEPKDTVFSGFVLRARPKKQLICDEFKAYCFACRSVRKQIVSTASYTTRALTNGKLLSRVSLILPPRAEQTAIATVLSDMDAEIAALERRRHKTQAIKQGMMQQLLTGRVRLIS